MKAVGGEGGGRGLTDAEQRQWEGEARGGSGKMRAEVANQTRREGQTQSRLRRGNLRNHRIQILPPPEPAAEGRCHD